MGRSRYHVWKVRGVQVALEEGGGVGLGGDVREGLWAAADGCQGLFLRRVWGCVDLLFLHPWLELRVAGVFGWCGGFRRGRCLGGCRSGFVVEETGHFGLRSGSATAKRDPAMGMRREHGI